MVTQTPNTDDPEAQQTPNSEETEATENADEQEALPEKTEQAPAFDFSEDEEFTSLRMALAGFDNSESQPDDSNNFEEFLNRLGTSEISLNMDTSEQTEKSDQSGETTKQHSALLPDEPTTNIRAYDPFDTKSPFSRPFGASEEPEETQHTRLPLSPIKNNGNRIDTSNDELTERINALNTESAQETSDTNVFIPPFVVEDSFRPEAQSNTITEKIRNGLLPAETLELLITKTMTEEEVTKIIKELGFDWNLTPGNSREEKIQALVSYLGNKEPYQNWDDFSEGKTPEFISQPAGEVWEESDNRLDELKDSLVIPEAPPEKTSFSLFAKNEDGYENSNPVIKWSIITLSSFAVILISVICYYLLTNKPAQQTSGQNTLQYPYPQILQLPGGWAFELTTGTVQDGSWNPQGAEWLEGTEVCKLISLPWNKQLNAVFQTIEAGDNIHLVMNNQDLMEYTVESTQTITAGVLNEITSRDSPCLVVIISRPEIEEHQAIVASPDFKPGPPAKAVTPSP